LGSTSKWSRRKNQIKGEKLVQIGGIKREKKEKAKGLRPPTSDNHPRQHAAADVRRSSRLSDER
jgi:hypothetical protein